MTLSAREADACQDEGIEVLDWALGLGSGGVSFGSVGLLSRSIPWGPARFRLGPADTSSGTEVLLVILIILLFCLALDLRLRLELLVFRFRLLRSARAIEFVEQLRFYGFFNIRFNIFSGVISRLVVVIIFNNSIRGLGRFLYKSFRGLSSFWIEFIRVIRPYFYRSLFWSSSTCSFSSFFILLRQASAILLNLL
jgi:hypothetical protein